MGSKPNPNPSLNPNPNVHTFDFLDDLINADMPVVPMPGTSMAQATTVTPNLDSSKVLNWNIRFYAPVYEKGIK